MMNGATENPGWPIIAPLQNIPSNQEIGNYQLGNGFVAASTGRDDFSAKTKQLLAQRVGWLCSHPKCRRPTLGPRMGELGVMNLGVAAHIRAASKEGPRYDKTQTKEERRSFANGIWLCQNHAHQIDNDKNHFTVEDLEGWKQSAEQRAFDELTGAGNDARVVGPTPELIEELREVVAALGLPEAEHLEDIMRRTKAAARAHIEGFHLSPGWPKHSILLYLTEERSLGFGNRFNSTRLGDLVQAVQEIVLVAPPGMGKTTTLIQVAEALLPAETVPVFVPLKEWAECGYDIFTWTANRNGFLGVRTEHLKFLAYHGRLTLLLDGWNEVPATARRRLITETEGLRRDFPLLSVIMSTRRQAIDVPLINPRRLKVLPLSEEQQEELASSLAGAKGLTVLDRARRTPGLLDLVSIPLYLTVLLRISVDGVLPETREEVLRRFIEEHENNPIRAEVLQTQLLGNQQHYLTGLAVEAHNQANTALNIGLAQRAVGKINIELGNAYIVQTPPNPATIIDLLVTTHALERDIAGNIAFQHHQFQEWYASHHFEQELRRATLPLVLSDPIAIDRLNDPNWGEAVLFACERVSRDSNGGERLIAAVVDIVLQIDPLFAANVIRRSSPSVWGIVTHRIQTFARQWHKAGQVDRGLGFMITTGREEFSDVVWPMVTSADLQTQLESLHAASHFYPAVLGEQLARDYASLDEDVRSNLLAGLIDNGGSAGIDTAMGMVLQDTSILVRHRVFDSLNSYAASRQAEELLRQSSDELFELIATKGHFTEVTATDLVQKLQACQQKQEKGVPADVRLARLMRSRPSDERSQLVAELLKDPTFNYESEIARNTLFYVARELPDTLEAALVDRIEAGEKLPWHTEEYISERIVRDTGPVSDFLKTPGTSAAKGAALIAGQDLTLDLCARYLASYTNITRPEIDAGKAKQITQDLEAVIKLTPASSFFAAISLFGPDTSPDDISRLCWLIAGHGRDHDKRSVLVPELCGKVTSTLQAWAEAMLSAGGNRGPLADVAGAMRRFPDPSNASVLNRMLLRDLQIYEEARQARLTNRKDRNAWQEAHVSHSNIYRNALIELGTNEASEILTSHLLDPNFGPDAAIGLMAIWRKRNDREERKPSRNWPDVETVIVNREYRRLNHTASTAEAEAIFAQVRFLLEHGKPEHLRRAAAMAGSAVLMPHGDKLSDLERLLGSNLPASCRYDLLSHMVVGGIVIKASDVIAGLDSALSEVEEHGWMNEHTFDALVRWVPLSLFSDEPRQIFPALERLPKTHNIPPWRISQIISDLASLTVDAVPGIINGLVTYFPELTKQYELHLALLKQPPRVLLDTILDIVNGRIGERPGFEDFAYHYPEQIFETLSPQDIQEVVHRYETEQPGPGKSLLGKVMIAANDPELFLILASNTDGQHIIGGRLHQILHNLLHDKLKINGMENHYELIPKDSSLLRRRLFVLALSADKTSATFAKRCLTIVDEIRDEQGVSGTEPRHPDISSGVPWPDVAY